MSQDFLADLFLVLPDVLVGVNLLGEQVGHDLHRPLAKDVALEDVGERGLGVYGEDQHLVPCLASQ